MTEIAPSVEAVDRTAGSAPEAVSRAASAAAGEDARIPRIFLGVGDLLVLALAFLAAHGFAPTVQQWFLAGGALEGVLPSVFPVPLEPRPDLFPPASEVIWLLVVTAPVTLVAIELLGGYRQLLGQSIVRLVLPPVFSQVVGISFCALIVFALKLASSSRVLIFTYGLVAACGLLAYRISVWTYQRRCLAAGVYAKNVLIIGDSRGVVRIAHHFQKYVPESAFRIAGWLSTEPGHADPPAGGRDDRASRVSITRYGRVDDLGELLVHNPIHEVVAVQSGDDRGWLRQVVEHCDYFRVRLRVVPEALLAGDLGDLQLANRGDPLRLPEVVLTPPYLDADALFVKRLIDVLVSAVLLVLLAPLFLLIAMAIKLTTPRLPVFYAWHVIGLNGRPFRGYKFTTMVADADEQRQLLLHLNEMQGPVFKIKDDPRVTPLGRLLRKFSLNELPQLWSVLNGDMSLVGPRPAGPHELVRYEMWHKRKLCVKPGMTCLWQISGRNRISDFDEWVRLDLEYIDRWSLWLDMRILARTVWAVVSGSGS